MTVRLKLTIVLDKPVGELADELAAAGRPDDAAALRRCLPLQAQTIKLVHARDGPIMVDTGDGKPRRATRKGASDIFKHLEACGDSADKLRIMEAADLAHIIGGYNEAAGLLKGKPPGARNRTDIHAKAVAWVLGEMQRTGRNDIRRLAGTAASNEKLMPNVASAEALASAQECIARKVKKTLAASIPDK